MDADGWTTQRLSKFTASPRNNLMYNPDGSLWEDDPMIGTATFVMLIAATAIADNAYPPCTQQRTDNCSAQQQAPGPTLYIPCPKGEYCPPHDIPRPKKQR